MKSLPKFRAFIDDPETNGKSMVNVTHLTAYNDHFYVGTIRPLGQTVWWWEVPVATLMEWTGYKDVDGVDIYDGDIVQFIKSPDKRKFQVKWKYFEDCCVRGETWVIEADEDIDINYCCNQSVFENHGNIRVIGNRYEGLR